VINLTFLLTDYRGIGTRRSVLDEVIKRKIPSSVQLFYHLLTFMCTLILFTNVFPLLVEVITLGMVTALELRRLQGASNKRLSEHVFRKL
jgi:hypothetical protein